MNIVSAGQEIQRNKFKSSVWNTDLGCGENILKNRGKWNEALKK
jgi:hypothetical protein